MSVTSIEYSEPNPKTYEAVKFRYNNNVEIKIFNSGDFVKDWYDCIKFSIFLEPVEPFNSCSSTVDHFIMDGAPFDSAYLKNDDNDDLYLSYTEIDGTEFFVKEGTKPTWLELRELCGDKKND